MRYSNFFKQSSEKREIRRKPDVQLVLNETHRRPWKLKRV